MQVSEKTTENAERLNRQERPKVVPGTFRQLVLSAKPLGHWQSLKREKNILICLQLFRHDCLRSNIPVLCLSSNKMALTFDVFNRYKHTTLPLFLFVGKN